MILHSSNFREIAVGKIAPGILYRSSHPCLNGGQVRDIICSASKAGIKTVINLSDSEWTLEWKIAGCSWYRRMFEAGNVIAVNIMQFDILDREFHKKLKDALLFMTERESPYLIHCEAGIDRTGFLSIIMEAFMGASLADIAKDYMLSFVDNGEYSPEDHKNGSVFVKDTFSRITGEPVQAETDLRVLAANFLAEQVKLDTDKLAVVAKKLSGPSSCDRPMCYTL
jgi:protein tyrosine/serine phosphatase